ncbi:hypothetical protein LTR09_004208 [Extremus antarcticus]|uniref:Uncharacterized protein n=1 Tax=Extremus antarcticus TaxID=702011 RepID=A0AAJ0GA16_9PEZI|nr:hypothetical protein LTR09_004208 [Extremus antarcticus]
MPLHASNPWRDETYYPGSLGVDFESSSSRRRSSMYEPGDSSHRARRDSSTNRYSPYANLDTGYMTMDYTAADGYRKAYSGEYRDLTEEERPRRRERSASRQRERTDRWFQMTDRENENNNPSSRRRGVADLYDNDYEVQRRYFEPRHSPERRESVRGRSGYEEERRSERRAESRERRTEIREPTYRRRESTTRKNSPDRRMRTRSPTRSSRPRRRSGDWEYLI